MNFRQVQDLAQIMMENDSDRDLMIEDMDAMWESRWELPDKLTMDWMHKVVSTDPHDAIRAGTRVLSSVSPRIRMAPLGPNDKDTVSRVERALSWHFKNASKRRRASILRDVVLSSLLYDEVVAQVVYLPHQIKQLKAFEGDTTRAKAAERYGPFSIIVHNPVDVNVRYSDYMPEAVLLHKIIPLRELVAFWGKRADKLEKKLDALEDAQEPYVTLYDYTDLDDRVVWAVPSPNKRMAGPDAGGASMLLKEEHKLGFLPWVARVGGTSLFGSGSMQRVPLLWSLHKSKQWATQNIAETLMISEIIAYAAAPRLKTTTFSGEGVEVDYGDAGRHVDIRPGEDVEAMLPPVLDENLALVSDRIQSRIAKSTVPNVLQTGDFPSGTAFATLNLATQSGIKSLSPYKELAELACADIFTQMLYWINKSGDSVISFYEDKNSIEQLVVTKDDFDVNNIYLEVELTADVPTDRMARINGAAMANEAGFISKESGSEEIGITDPGAEREQIRTEMNEDTEHQILILKRMEEVKREEQLKTNEAMFQQQMKQQQAMQPPGPDQGSAAAGLRNPATQQQFAQQRGYANAGGQGFSPNQGGNPPAMANPNGTRESMRGTSFTGDALVE